MREKLGWEPAARGPGSCHGRLAVVGVWAACWGQGLAPTVPRPFGLLGEKCRLPQCLARCGQSR